MTRALLSTAALAGLAGLAGCSEAVTETGADAEAAWPQWAPLPGGETLGWYHREDDGAETWGVALDGGDLGDDVVYESGGEDWQRMTSGTGVIVDGMYDGPNGREWELCRDGALMQVYDFPQASTFIDGTEFDDGVTQVYVYDPGRGCD